MKVRYSHLYNLGGYENEKVEVEREFSESMDYSTALSQLIEEVEQDHENRTKMRSREILRRHGVKGGKTKHDSV